MPMSQHDRDRMERALACDRNSLSSLRDAVLGLQSTDDPSLVPLYDELLDRFNELAAQKLEGKMEIQDSYTGPKTRAEFEAYKVMLIEVSGNKRPESDIKLPRTRDDGGLISELYKFMEKEHITPVKVMSKGGGQMSALFTIPAGEKITDWLAKNGGMQVGNYSSGG